MSNGDPGNSDATWSLRAIVDKVAANRRYIWALATPLVTLALSLLLNRITSRLLAPEGFGQFAVMIGFMTTAGAIVGLGLPVTLARFSAAARSSDERDRFRMAAWILVIGVGLFVLAILTTIDVISPGLLSRWITPGSAAMVGAGALGVALVDLAAADSQGQLAFRGYFGRLVGGSAARVIGVVAALWTVGVSAASAVGGYAMACLLTGGVLAIRSIHGAGRRETLGTDAFADTIRRIMAFAMPVLGSTIVVAVTLYVDTMIVASVLPGDEVGWYSAASRLTIAQSTLIGGMSAIALPLAARAVAEGREPAFVSFALRLPGFVGLCVTIGFVALSGLIIGVIYGASFQPAASVFAILSIGLLPNFFGNPISQLLYARGKPGRMLWVHLAQLAALILLLPNVASRFGIDGVAMWRSVVNVVAVSAVIWIAVKSRGGATTQAQNVEIAPDLPSSQT